MSPQTHSTESAERPLTVAVRVSEQERAALSSAAKKVGLTPAAWLRMLGLKAAGEGQGC